MGHETHTLEPGFLLEYEVTEFRDTSCVVYFSQFPIHVSWAVVSLCGLRAFVPLNVVPRGFVLSLPILDRTLRARYNSTQLMNAHLSNPAACIMLV